MTRREARGRARDHELYRVWCSMRGRCDDPSQDSYCYYGARGVDVCRRWRESFWSFVDDMGPRPPGYQIDRIDPNGNYAPHNCRWVSPRENRRNRRKSDLVMITALGKTQCLTDWAAETGLPYTALHQRFHAGWDAERLVTQPLRLDSRHAEG